MVRGLPVSIVAPAGVLFNTMIALVAVWWLVSAAQARDFRDEPALAGEPGVVQEEPAAGENVGEPAAEDAPVEGEPAAGEAPVVPPDDQPANDVPSSPPPPDDAAKK